MPHIVLAVGVMLVLGPLGLLDSYTGIFLAHLITTPYTVRTITMSLMTVDRRVEEAARVHGASPAMVLWRITLPLVRPGLIAGAVIAFLISFDEATISLFIVSVKSSTLPTEIYHYLEYSTDPQIAAYPLSSSLSRSVWSWRSSGWSVDCVGCVQPTADRQQRR